MKQLSMQMVTGAGSVLLNSSTVDIINSIGITGEEWELINGSRPWIGVDRSHVTRILDSLLFGMIDTIGLPRFELPAEYVATLVALFVHPVNYFSACSWLGSFQRGDDLANYTGKLEPIEGFEKCKAQTIFALVCQIRSTGSLKPMAQKFQQKTEFKLALLKDAV